MTTMYGLYAIQRYFEIPFQECCYAAHLGFCLIHNCLEHLYGRGLIQMVTLLSNSRFPSYKPPPHAFRISEIRWVKPMPVSA